jgi:hypothetical protein
MKFNANAQVYVWCVSPFSMPIMLALLKKLNASMFMFGGHKFALKKS